MKKAEKEAPGAAKRKSPSATEIRWQDRPNLQMNTAAQILGLSPASLYRASIEGRLKLIRLAGRTLVDTASLIAMQATAEPWAPSKTGEAARRSRSHLSERKWRR